METVSVTTIDAYIAGFPEATQVLLEQVRQTVRQAAPNAEEAISYGMPTLKQNGNLVHFAAFKNHIGFYPAPQGLEAFKQDLSQYKGAKGSVQFPLDEPLPLALIAKITRFRLAQNLAKAEGKSKKKTPAKPGKGSDQEQVTAHMQQLDPALAKVVETIRQLILSTDTEIGERIKWNNPSFYYTGDMKPFDPKEYKREIAVFNLYKGKIMLVFPSGSKVNDTTGLLEGDYADGRKIAVFKDAEDVESKKTALQYVIKKWLERVEK
jgi:uncharacterized protein YdhG (YjbR/CyaY superfamily)